MPLAVAPYVNTSAKPHAQLWLRDQGGPGGHPHKRWGSADDKDRLIADYEEVLEIYKKHVARLEKLVKLKDSKIETQRRKIDVLDRK